VIPGANEVLETRRLTAKSSSLAPSKTHEKVAHKAAGAFGLAMPILGTIFGTN
jgi:hypothetical protein